jgi:ribosomal 50S subunit-recycling heat shock protein
MNTNQLIEKPATAGPNRTNEPLPSGKYLDIFFRNDYQKRKWLDPEKRTNPPKKTRMKYKIVWVAKFFKRRPCK